MSLDPDFDLDRFLHNAVRSAHYLGSCRVSDKEGRSPGGFDLIMLRLIEILHDYRNGNGAKWEPGKDAE